MKELAQQQWTMEINSTLIYLIRLILKSLKLSAFIRKISVQTLLPLQISLISHSSESSLNEINYIDI